MSVTVLDLPGLARTASDADCIGITVNYIVVLGAGLAHIYVAPRKTGVFEDTITIPNCGLEHIIVSNPEEDEIVLVGQVPSCAYKVQLNTRKISNISSASHPFRLVANKGPYSVIIHDGKYKLFKRNKQVQVLNVVSPVHYVFGTRYDGYFKLFLFPKTNRGHIRVIDIVTGMEDEPLPMATPLVPPGLRIANIVPHGMGRFYVFYTKQKDARSRVLDSYGILHMLPEWNVSAPVSLPTKGFNDSHVAGLYGDVAYFASRNSLVVAKGLDKLPPPPLKIMDLIAGVPCSYGAAYDSEGRVYGPDAIVPFTPDLLGFLEKANAVDVCGF